MEGAGERRGHLLSGRELRYRYCVFLLFLISLHPLFKKFFYMKSLIPFSIPVSGLRDGTHGFNFEVDAAFFAAFSESPVQQGALQVHLDFDKRPGMFVLEFDISGRVVTPCDRCLETIQLPIEGRHRLLVKFSDEERPDEADVVYVSPELEKLNVAQYVYEFIILSLPMVKVYDCENDEDAVCNEDMLSYLEEDADSGSETIEEANPIWDELKKKLNK